jgi:hypothetical protein
MTANLCSRFIWQRKLCFAFVILGFAFAVFPSVLVADSKTLYVPASSKNTDTVILDGSYLQNSLVCTGRNYCMFFRRLLHIESGLLKITQNYPAMSLDNISKNS